MTPGLGGASACYAARRSRRAGRDQLMRIAFVLTDGTPAPRELIAATVKVSVSPDPSPVTVSVFAAEWNTCGCSATPPRYGVIR